MISLSFAGELGGEERVGCTGKRLLMGSLAPWTGDVGGEGRDPVRIAELDCLDVGVSGSSRGSWALASPWRSSADVRWEVAPMKALTFSTLVYLAGSMMW